MKFNKVNKAEAMGLFEIIKFQIMTHCFLKNIRLNETELNCLAYLGTSCARKKDGKIRQIDFCRVVEGIGIFGSLAAAVNCLQKIEHTKLFLKSQGGKKMLWLNPELNIVTTGNIFLEYKFVHVNEGNTLEGHSKEDSRTAQLAGTGS